MEQLQLMKEAHRHACWHVDLSETIVPSLLPPQSLSSVQLLITSPSSAQEDKHTGACSEKSDKLNTRSLVYYVDIANCGCSLNPRLRAFEDLWMCFLLSIEEPH